MNITNNTASTIPSFQETYEPIEYQPTDFLYVFTFVASAIANVIIVSVISRYSVMWTRSNLYLVNWCLCNFIIVLLAPIWLNLFGLAEFFSFDYACIWEEPYHGMSVGNLLFVIMLFLDWYMVSYTNQRYLFRCKQAPKFIIGIVWIVTVSISVASATFCSLNYSYNLAFMCLSVVFLSVFIAIILVHVLRCVKIKIFKAPAAKSKIELIIVSSYFLCWLPYLIWRYGQMPLGINFGSAYEFASSFIGHSHAWIMLIILYYCDKPFRVYLTKSFGGKRITSDNPSITKEQSTVLL